MTALGGPQGRADRRARSVRCRYTHNCNLGPVGSTGGGGGPRARCWGSSLRLHKKNHCRSQKKGPCNTWRRTLPPSAGDNLLCAEAHAPFRLPKENPSVCKRTLPCVRRREHTPDVEDQLLHTHCETLPFRKRNTPHTQSEEHHPPCAEDNPAISKRTLVCALSRGRPAVCRRKLPQVAEGCPPLCLPKQAPSTCTRKLPQVAEETSLAPST